MSKQLRVKSKISLRQKIILAVFGLFLALVVLEIGLRIGGFVILYIQDQRNKVSLRRKNAYRIMCIGESTTQGEYPRFLEEILNKGNTGKRFCVIDKGLSGANTGIILNQLEANLDKYNPDMVIAMLGINDSWQTRPYRNGSVSKAALFFRSFRVYKLAKILRMHFTAKAQEMRIGRMKKGICLEKGQWTNPLEFSDCDRISPIPDEFFRQVIALNPVNDRMYFGLGSIYLRKERFAEAEEMFKKAIELNPQNDRAHFGLGRLYLRQEKTSLAEEYFKKAIELNPQNDRAHFGLGRLYLQQEKISLAEEYFKKAIEINPKNDRAYSELGLFLLNRFLNQRNFPPAESLLKRALELNPRNSEVCFVLGYFYLEEGRLFEAEELFKRSIELNPINDRLHAALFTLYVMMGRHEAAQEYYKKTNALRLEYYHPMTVINYRRIKDILDKRHIRMTCVQYPLRNLEPLKKVLGVDVGIIFVDNEKIFKDAVDKDGYRAYFADIFGGDFGHCTEKGNRLLAQNIGDTILREMFGE